MLNKNQNNNHGGVFYKNAYPSSMGTWLISGDSLLLETELYCKFREDSLSYSPVDKYDTMESGRFLYKIKGDYLYDITDYSAQPKTEIDSILNLPPYYSNPTVPDFKLIRY